MAVMTDFEYSVKSATLLAYIMVVERVRCLVSCWVDEMVCQSVGLTVDAWDVMMAFSVAGLMVGERVDWSAWWELKLAGRMANNSAELTDSKTVATTVA